MAHAGEDHSEAEPVGGGEYVGIAHRAAGLNEGGGAGLGGLLDAVRKRKERVGGDHTARERRLRFHHGDFDGIDAAHLAGADTDGGSILGENNGVDLTCFATCQAKRSVSISSAVGTRLVTVLRSCSLNSPRSGSWTRTPPRMRLSWSSRSGCRPPGGSSSRRRFFFVAKMAFAFSSKPGAAMHSTKSLATSSAVAASIGLLKASTPP